MLETGERAVKPLHDAIVVSLTCLHFLRIDFAVSSGHTEIRRSLEDSEMFGLLRDLGNGLHRCSASADNSNSFCGEIDAAVREAAGVIPFALERFETFELRQVRRRQGSYRGDEVTGCDVLSFVSAHPPEVGAFVKCRAGHASPELHI